MNEPRAVGRARRRRLRGGGWPLALVGLLAAALLVDGLLTTEALRAESPDRSRVSELRATLAGLPRRPLVVVGMDGDLGSYPEIRGTVRSLLDELLERDARLAMVSYSPEGRAIAAAEVERLFAAGVDPDQLVDLGFVAGSEAGLVLSVTELVPAGADAPLAARIVEAGDGIAAFDLAIVVGGTDFGPRPWVEQVGTRLPALPIVAVVPTFAYPELAPYLRTGQLAALLGTTRDGAAWAGYVAGRRPPPPTGSPPSAPAPLPMLLGTLVALAVIGRAAAGGRGGPVEPDPDGEEPA